MCRAHVLLSLMEGERHTHTQAGAFGKALACVHVVHSPLPHEDTLMTFFWRVSTPGRSVSMLSRPWSSSLSIAATEFGLPDILCLGVFWRLLSLHSRGWFCRRQILAYGVKLLATAMNGSSTVASLAALSMLDGPASGRNSPFLYRRTMLSATRP